MSSDPEDGRVLRNAIEPCTKSRLDRSVPSVRIRRRAAEIVTNRFNDVRVQLAHDKVASDGLEQLSRNADVFIVNTWDAKHAATDAIQAHRLKTSITVIPNSKSAGSLVREIYDYVESTTELKGS